MIPVGISTCVGKAGAVAIGPKSEVPGLKIRIGTIHRQQSTSRLAPAIMIFPVRPEFQNFLILFIGLFSAQIVKQNSLRKSLHNLPNFCLTTELVIPPLRKPT